MSDETQTKTLEHVVGLIEDHIQAQDGPANSHTEKGTPYVMLCSGGIKPEGERLRVLCSTPQQAIDIWQKDFSEYLDAFLGLHKTTVGNVRLWWRERPQIGNVSFREAEWPTEWEPAEYFIVYSRLALELA